MACVGARRRWSRRTLGCVAACAREAIACLHGAHEDEGVDVDAVEQIAFFCVAGVVEGLEGAVGLRVEDEGDVPRILLVLTSSVRRDVADECAPFEHDLERVRVTLLDLVEVAGFDANVVALDDERPRVRYGGGLPMHVVQCVRRYLTEHGSSGSALVDISEEITPDILRASRTLRLGRTSLFASLTAASGPTIDVGLSYRNRRYPFEKSWGIHDVDDVHGGAVVGAASMLVAAVTSERQ